MDGSTLTKYLLEKYAKNPKGWNFTIAPSRKDSFFNALVNGPEESWQLKIDSIFKPTPIIVGARTEIDQKGRSTLYWLDSTPSYGYRRLEPEAILKFLGGASSGLQGGATPEQNFDDMLRSIEPTAPSTGASYAQGPFVYTNQEIGRISDNQRNLDERLGSEIRSILHQRYRSYG